MPLSLSLLKVSEQLQPSFEVARSIRATLPRHQPGKDCSVTRGSRHCLLLFLPAQTSTAILSHPTPPHLQDSRFFSLHKPGVSPMGWGCHPSALLKTTSLDKAPCLYIQIAPPSPPPVWSDQRCRNSWEGPIPPKQCHPGVFPLLLLFLSRQGGIWRLPYLAALVQNSQLSLRRMRLEGWAQCITPRGLQQGAAACDLHASASSHRDQESTPALKQRMVTR